MTLSAGTRLGAYEILSPLGAGGMGEVYRARDSKLGRDAAIKVLPEGVTQDAERLARFEREARALAALNHPGIVTIYSVEQSGETRFLAMELVEGESLDMALSPGAFSLARFFEVAVPLADALSAAHERGIVHRDLKPANVMITPEGRVKVLDFGLAKLEAAASDPNVTGVPTESRVELTGEGKVFGTVAYMSPEQARGGKIDARSDVFSLGVVLYQMLTGERPFQGASAVDMISSILRDTPRSVTELRTDLPPHLARILRRCLEKDPRDRYQTSRDVFNELRDLRTETASAPSIRSPRSEPVMPESAAARAPGAAGRRAWAVAVAAVLLGVALYVAARSGVFHSGSRAPETGGAPRAIQSIAVLPLDNYSGDPGQDYFAEGMTDELTSALANVSQLRVISRGSAMQFKGAKRPPTPEIARALNVDAIVEGSVLRAGDRVRITAQLIDARADRHLWSKSFERNSRDVLALQDELASAIAREIHVRLTPADESRLTRAPTVNPEAYDAYLKGRYFFNRPSDENLSKAIAQFEEAMKLDPKFAARVLRSIGRVPLGGIQRGCPHRLGGGSQGQGRGGRGGPTGRRFRRGAHVSCRLQDLVRTRLGGAESEFRRAFAPQSNYAFAHDQFGLALAYEGRLDESVAEGRIAAELDPLSPQVPVDALIAFAWKGQYQAAKELSRRAANLDPTFFFPPFMDGWIDIQAGKVGDAIPQIQKARAMEPPPFVAAWLGYAYGATGDRERATAAIEEMKTSSLRGYVPPFNLAIVYLGLGDRARALDNLERASEVDSQWLIYLRGDRIFDPLRSEPRFAALMKKLGFDDRKP